MQLEKLPRWRTVFENTIFLISFSWASIAGSSVNMDSFLGTAPPHLCGACGIVPAHSGYGVPGQPGCRETCRSPLKQRPPMCHWAFVGGNPRINLFCSGRTVQSEEGVSPKSRGQIQVQEGSCWLPHWVLCGLKRSLSPGWPASTEVKGWRG